MRRASEMVPLRVARLTCGPASASCDSGYRPCAHFLKVSGRVHVPGLREASRCRSRRVTWTNGRRLAFVATAVSSLFAQAMLVRYTRDAPPQDRAWAIALALFALASAALATGTSTGWDHGTFRVFYLLGAVLNVPWLALGTVYLLCAGADGPPSRAVGWSSASPGSRRACCSAPRWTRSHGTAIPVGKDVFGALPRVLAAVGSGVAAVVIFVRRGRARRCASPVTPAFPATAAWPAPTA